MYTYVCMMIYPRIRTECTCAIVRRRERGREKSIATAGLVISIFPSRDHVYYGVHKSPPSPRIWGARIGRNPIRKKVDRKSIDITARENVPFFRKSPRMGKALGSQPMFIPILSPSPAILGPGKFARYPFTDG